MSRGRESSGRGGSDDAESGSAMGSEFWATAAYLMVALLLVFVMLGALPSESRRAAPVVEAPVSLLPTSPAPGPHPEPAESAPPEPAWRQAAARLCEDPQLAALGIQVECATGSLTLSNRAFFRPHSSELRDSGMAKLRAAVPAALATLRDAEVLEDQLEMIEVRGHADPYARRDPYTANLWRSQARAATVLGFLTTDEEVPEADRRLLRERAVASGASFSRPPVECPEPDPACIDSWRRVEIVFHW